MHRSPILTAAGFTLAALVPTLALGGGGAIDLPDPGFAPEGISASADGTLYAGSITQGRIVAISAAHGRVSEFAPAGLNGMVSVIGVHVTTDGARVAACSSDPGAGALTGQAAPALVLFDRATGAPAGRYELPEGGVFCNDIAELPDGTLLATDSFVPRIYALRPGAGALETWFEDDALQVEGFNLNGIAVDDDAVWVLRYGAGELLRIPLGHDMAAGAAEVQPLARPIHGADGLNALGHGRFLVVEGGGLTAGARGNLLGVTLRPDGPAQVDVLAADLNVPTTAHVVGGTAFVVEGQLDHLFDPEAGPADPYRVLRIPLPAAYR